MELLGAQRGRQRAAGTRQTLEHPSLSPVLRLKPVDGAPRPRMITKLRVQPTPCGADNRPGPIGELLHSPSDFKPGSPAACTESAAAPRKRAFPRGFPRKHTPHPGRYRSFFGSAGARDPGRRGGEPAARAPAPHLTRTPAPRRRRAGGRPRPGRAGSPRPGPAASPAAPGRGPRPPSTRRRRLPTVGAEGR